MTRYLSPMNRATILPACVFSGITLLTGCKVYYTTSDVDANLKSTVDKVNTTLSNLQSQVAELEKQYREIPCEQKSEVILKADGMVHELDGEMRSLEQLKQTVNNDYKFFAQYTKGKSRIESGTEEWKKLKETKAAMKNNLDALQNQGNTVVDEAQKFNAFVHAQVVPTVQVCEVKSYTSQFEKAVSTLGSNLQIAQSDLKKYDSQIASIKEQFGATAAATCNQLAELAKQIRIDIDAMQPIHRNTQRILTEFKVKTKGLQRIYSCNANWRLVAETEAAIGKQEQDFNAHSQSITAAAASIQQLVNSLQR